MPNVESDAVPALVACHGFFLGFYERKRHELTSHSSLHCKLSGSVGAGPEGQDLTLRVKVVIQRVQQQKHEPF